MRSTFLVRPVFFALIGTAVSVGAAGSVIAQDYRGVPAMTLKELIALAVS